MNQDNTRITPSLEQLQAERQAAVEHLESIGDPNAPDACGEMPLTLSIRMCFDGHGENRVAHLLKAGADPNKPSPWATFVLLLTTTKSLPLIELTLDSGLRLNDVFDTSRDAGHLTEGPSTLLDHADAVQDFVSPRHKRRNALAVKHAGGLHGRRKFIADVIAALETRGAKRYAEIASTDSDEPE